jgi:hypothetical protein
MEAIVGWIAIAVANGARERVGSRSGSTSADAPGVLRDDLGHDILNDRGVVNPRIPRALGFLRGLGDRLVPNRRRRANPIVDSRQQPWSRGSRHEGRRASEYGRDMKTIRVDDDDVIDSIAIHVCERDTVERVRKWRRAGIRQRKRDDPCEAWLGDTIAKTAKPLTVDVHPYVDLAHPIGR